MVDGIFNDRLKGDLIAIITKTAFIHLKFILKLILISKFLDLQIASGMFYLFFNGDQFMATADADAEQPGTQEFRSISQR